MGWAQSPPPFFCAFTETIADLANSGPISSTHQGLTETQSTHHIHSPHMQFRTDAITLGAANAPPLAYTDVYIDDFMVIAQPPQHLPT